MKQLSTVDGTIDKVAKMLMLQLIKQLSTADGTFDDDTTYDVDIC